MTEEEVPIQEQIKKALRNLTIATVVLYLALVGVVGFAYVDSNNRRAELEQVAFSTNNALCALRADLERRIETSERFLAENPNGIPGFSAEEIQQSIENQERTVLALEDLDCG